MSDTTRLVVRVSVVGALMSSALAMTPCAAARLAPQAPDKRSRTPAQQKIDSHLLDEIARRADKSSTRPADPLVKVDARDRALVDVRADVSDALLDKVRRAGAVIVSTSIQYRSIVAWYPVSKLESLAGDPIVRAIVPAAEAITQK